MNFNIICASHDDEVLNKNLGASELFKKNHRVRVIKGGNNVARAYQEANKVCFENEYNLFVHHDLFLPPAFEQDLTRAINEINLIDAKFGVLGVAGAILENGKKASYGNIKDRGREWGAPLKAPKEVQTLDELLLITKGDLKFDEQFDLHFYGADICLSAIKEGRKNYAINAYCHHNSSLKIGYRSQSFKDCEARFKEKWKVRPIVTTCSLIL